MCHQHSKGLVDSAVPMAMEAGNLMGRFTLSCAMFLLAKLTTARVVLLVRRVGCFVAPVGRGNAAPNSTTQAARRRQQEFDSLRDLVRMRTLAHCPWMSNPVSRRRCLFRQKGGRVQHGAR